MQWINAKKTRYTTSVHKLSENDQHIFKALSSSSTLGLQTEMFPLWLHFQLVFNSQLFYQNMHSYYLPNDDLWQGNSLSTTCSNVWSTFNTVQILSFLIIRLVTSFQQIRPVSHSSFSPLTILFRCSSVYKKSGSN